MIRLATPLVALVLAAFGGTAAAAPLTLSYGGRLTASDGAPVGGPVTLGIRLFHGVNADVPSPVTLADQDGVALRDGVFQIALSVAPADLDAAFGPAETWIEITDKTHAHTYPKQRFLAVPYALRVPIDGTTLAYDAAGQLTVAALDQTQVAGLDAALSAKSDLAHTHALSGDVTGALGTTVVARLNGSPVTAATPTINQVLQWNGTAWAPATVGGVGTPESTTASNAAAGTGAGLFKAQSIYDLIFRKLNAGAGITVTQNTDDVTVASTITQYTDALARSAVSATAPVAYSAATGVVSMPVATGAASGYLAASDFTTFNGKQAAITAASVVNAGTLTSALQNGLELKPYGAAGGNTGELRFDELAANGSNYVAMKAPDDVATTVTFTLPAVTGTAGQLLKTDGAGNLSWVTATGGSVTSVATGTGLTGGPVTTTGTVSLANTAVTPGSYARANVTVDQQGRLTAASSGANVNLASEVTGTLPLASGGTGLAAAGGANKILGMNAGDTALEYKTLSGTTDQISIVHAAGSMTLSTPQSIATTSSPTFAGLKVSGEGVGIGTTSPSALAALDLVSTTKGFLPPRMTAAQRLALSSPPAGLQVFDTTGNVLLYYNGTRWLEPGAPPIGSIQAWDKSNTGTPSLPWGWKECDGSVVSDTQSPYNGTNVRSLNSNTQDGTTSSGMFLRGASTSGTVQASLSNTLGSTTYTYGAGFPAFPTSVTIPATGAVTAAVAAWNNPGYNYTAGLILQNTGAETRPANMTVVWICRIK